MVQSYQVGGSHEGNEPQRNVSLLSLRTIKSDRNDSS